ncbi:MAG: hypothetical protein WBA74_16430, partial [Cyclobacteriaceae bacterium]
YELKDGYSLIKDRFSSQLFFFYGNDTLFLANEVKSTLQQAACQLAFETGDQFTGEEIGDVAEFRVGQILVKDKEAVSCVPMFFEMDAYLFYNSNHLTMSHTVSDIETSGWLQIE